VDAFITLTEFQREMMINAGLPEERVYVKPNFYPGNPEPVMWKDRGNYVVFAGRLSPEKGVETLVRAWLRWGWQAPELRVLGDGPLREPLERLAASVKEVHIQFFGQVPAKDAEHEIARSKLLILPSVCFEGFPMVIREAFAFGTPVAVSDIGPLPSIVQHGVSGVVFAPGDADALMRVVQEVWNTPGALERLSIGTREAFQREFTEESNYETLMKIYTKAITVNRECT
jgi:glycosyltransferase involved in cell wall biosynthesis